MKIFISGTKFFGEEVLRMCLSMGHDVVGVCCPIGDKYIGRLAALHNIEIIPAGTLTGDTFPDGVDLGITAHSFDYIGRVTRYRPRLGWIGYHPSLLPRHRGRSSIEWAVRMGDVITGGSVYWLNSGIDRGDIIIQDWCWIYPELRILGPKEAAKRLWRGTLLDMGIKLLGSAISQIEAGTDKRTPQDDRVSTYEPSTDRKDIFKPDLLMIEQKNV